MNGKVVLITGASSGLGLAAAEGFARLGATVWLVVRSRERGEHARARIAERSGNGDVHVALCDLSNLESVRQFAGRFGDQASRLDVLVNNAGVMTQERALSADGIELTLATNVVGPFALTNLLIALLQRSAPARIINVSSGGMYTQKVRVEDLQSEHGAVRRANGLRAHQARAGDPHRDLRASGWRAPESWSTRCTQAGQTPPACDPRCRASTQATRPLLRTPAQGADTIVWLAAAAEPGHSSGGFWHDRRQRPTHLLPWTRETRQERERLLAECVRLSALQITSPGAASSNPEGEP